MSRNPYIFQEFEFIDKMAYLRILLIYGYILTIEEALVVMNKIIERKVGDYILLMDQFLKNYNILRYTSEEDEATKLYFDLIMELFYKLPGEIQDHIVKKANRPSDFFLAVAPTKFIDIHGEQVDYKEFLRIISEKALNRKELNRKMPDHPYFSRFAWFSQSSHFESSDSSEDSHFSFAVHKENRKIKQFELDEFYKRPENHSQEAELWSLVFHNNLNLEEIDLEIASIELSWVDELYLPRLESIPKKAQYFIQIWYIDYFCNPYRYYDEYNEPNRNSLNNLLLHSLIEYRKYEEEMMERLKPHVTEYSDRRRRKRSIKKRS